MDVTEKYFRALGWVQCEGHDALMSLPYWEAPETLQGTLTLEQLPNITQSYPDFKKFVLEKMEGDYFVLIVMSTFIEWKNMEVENSSYTKTIKDNEILEAAVIAATRYFENKVV